MAARFLRLVLIASMALGACERPAIDPATSLVGAKSFPSEFDLSNEVIGLYSNFDKTLSRRLSFELTPDNRWDVILTDSRSDKELSRKSTQLDSPLASRIRHKLWRLRPEKLDGVEWPHDPSDCPPQPTDTGPDVVIAFVEEGSKPDADDNRIGVATLPSLTYCDTPNNRAARALVDEVLRSMPGGNLRAQYKYSPPIG